MKRIVFAVALLSAAALIAPLVTADEAKKAEAKLSKKEFSKVMKDAHHGEKSPHAKTAVELKKESPNWEEIATSAKAFTAMGDSFKRVELGYTSPTKYNDSAAALAKAVGAKDKKAATEAFTGLTQSCAACHFYGGARGGLEK